MTIRIYEITKIVINALLSLITFFLLTRVLFLFFSANQATPFVAWVLDVSSFLMTPFAGILPNASLATGVLDIVALVTLLAYSLIGYMLIAMLDKIAEPGIIEEEHQAAAHYHDIEKDLSDHHH